MAIFLIENVISVWVEGGGKRLIKYQKGTITHISI